MPAKEQPEGWAVHFPISGYCPSDMILGRCPRKRGPHWQIEEAAERRLRQSRYLELRAVSCESHEGVPSEP